MAEDEANPNPPGRPNVFRGGTLDDYSSSGTVSDSVSKTASVLTQFSPNSVPGFRPQTRRPHKPKYELTPTMAPISAATIQHALRNLRPVSHPDDFPAVTSNSRLLSPVSSPMDSHRNPKNVKTDPIHSPLTPKCVTPDQVPSPRTPKSVTTDPIPSLWTPKSVTTDPVPSPRSPKIVTTDPIPSPRTPQSVSTDLIPSPRFFIGSSMNSITSDESEILNSNMDVSHPDDFPAVTSNSRLLSPVSSPMDSHRNPKNVKTNPIDSPLTPKSVTPDQVPSPRKPKSVTTDPIPSLRTPTSVTTDPVPSPRSPKSVTTDPIPSPRTPQSVSTDLIPSPRFFIGSSTSSITSDESEILNSNMDVLRSIRRSRELTRSVAAYLRSVGVCVEPPPEQDYPPTTEAHYEFLFTPEEEDTRSIHQGEEHELTPEERAAPQSPDVTIQRFASWSSGDRPRVTPTILEQILEAKNNLKPVHRNEDERNYNIMDLHNEVNSDIKGDKSKEKKSRKCRLLCCFRSPQVDE